MPFKEKRSSFRVVDSRPHMSKETKDYIDHLMNRHDNIEMISIGSSLKFCLMAEGMANIYPGFSPTMEWDTAAGQAIVEASGGNVVDFITRQRLKYNKESLLNPCFIAKRE